MGAWHYRRGRPSTLCSAFQRWVRGAGRVHRLERLGDADHAAGRPGHAGDRRCDRGRSLLPDHSRGRQPIGQHDIVESLQSASLNRRDAEEFQRGYYENLLDVGRFNRELQQIYEKMPKDFVRSLAVLGMPRRTGDEQEYELVPNKEGRFVGGHGAHQLGAFAIASTRRNVRQTPTALRCSDPPRRWDPGSRLMNRLKRWWRLGSTEEFARTLEEVRDPELRRCRVHPVPRAVPARAEGVLVRTPHGNFPRARQRSRWHVIAPDGSQGVSPARPLSRRPAAPLGPHSQAGPNEARRRVKPFEGVAWLGLRPFRHRLPRARYHASLPLHAAGDRTGESWSATERGQILALAKEAGFPILDLSGVFHNRGKENLWIAENDAHPNALGSRLVADKLYELLRARQEELSWV